MTSRKMALVIFPPWITQHIVHWLYDARVVVYAIHWLYDARVVLYVILSSMYHIAHSPLVLLYDA